MDTGPFIAYLQSLRFYKDQLVHTEPIPLRRARYGEPDKPLPAPIQARLDRFGISRLFSHQSQAINVARAGQNIVVATSSASGKTLSYNLPVLESILENAASRALYLFPTKALSQDQLRALRALGGPLLQESDVATFDGDTALEHRAFIKKRARIVLTNPDMLHLGILPNHHSWSSFLRHLRFVVLDEAHIYRGVFGSHVGCVMRRLLRLCALMGSRPQFIVCSATIANPIEHAQNLVGLPFQLIDDDGSPYGGKDFIFWNPPVIDKARNTRRSANSEATALFTELVARGTRSLTFVKTRRLAELIYIYSRNKLTETAPELASRIKPYRAGYLPEERRAIEQELFRGDLLGAVTTTALEVGIDIGNLEATILLGYPGSIASTWQQAGRSGRRGARSISFLIGLDNPLDQYFMHHPRDFFNRKFENALTNITNPHILKSHLLCAAWESPLVPADSVLFRTDIAPLAAELEAKGLLKQKAGKWYPAVNISYPAQHISIRSASTINYAIRDLSRNNQLLETVEASVAFSQVHPGAIYLHQGEAYLITELDVAGRTAYATPSQAPYYTQAREITEISITGKLQEKPAGKTRVYLGRARVTTSIIGFRKKAQFSEEVVGEEELDLPAQTFDTVSFWFDIPEGALKQVIKNNLDLAGGLHATEHAAIALLPLFALCDRNDIGGVSTALHWETGKPQVFIYDAYPGGIGIAEKGFELAEELWRATLALVKDCPCGDGCPSCIQSPKCGNNNQPLDKAAAVIVLEGLL